MNAAALKKQEKNKQDLIAKTLGCSSKSALKSDHLINSFMGGFCAQIPAEDIAPWEAEELHAIARSIYALSKKRKPDQTCLRIYNPDQKKHKWHVNRTVIEIVNADMPFLIDSIAAELLGHHHVIDVLFHPILNIQRDSKGHLQHVGDARAKGDGYLSESYIHIQLESLLSQDEQDKLEKKLRSIIDDVSRATCDWQVMLERLEGTISSLSQMPKPSDIEAHDEARLFLQYVHANNFTFLGYRRDDLKGQGAARKFVKARNSGLGLLANGKKLLDERMQSEGAVKALNKSNTPVVISKLIGQKSTVHRRVPYDIIIVKILDKKGKLIGRHVFLGLFTSSTYSCRTSEVPIVRQKVQETLRKASFGHDTHDHKALEHILEKYPRDELFQVDVRDLIQTALGILRLQERHRTALFTRMDILGRSMSCLVYVPRDVYDSGFRKKAAMILEQGFDGHVTSFHTTLDDSPLARILFTIDLRGSAHKTYNIQAIENNLINVSRRWTDALKHELLHTEGKVEGAALWSAYQNAFSSAYTDKVTPEAAVYDIREIEQLRHDRAINIDLYRVKGASSHEYRLKVYHDHAPVPLSDILQILEKMGLRVISELPFEISPQNLDHSVWIHDFTVETQNGQSLDLKHIKQSFEDAFLNIWKNKAENDFLNTLVLQGLEWRQVNILRTYLTYLRQVKFPYSRRYIQTVLSTYPEISSQIVQMFLVKHDPNKAQKTAQRAYQRLKSQVLKSLEDVAQLDHDRILRALMSVIEHTLRTNYYQLDKDGQPKDWLSIKIHSEHIDFVPKPRPFVEIFLYSTRVEAVHLRCGPIARGGLRWSDRHDDFRTEILGLVKAQNVKNAVIVPLGSKGGFVLKQPPKTGGRQAYLEEGIACYKIFIQGMLDITDNLVKGKIVKPKNVVCHDGDDPYLVVAADKGTATFSDIANAISLENNFWLGDAFASGGSAGYDHKAMGITARGAWESVKRHFREIGKDIQREDFTCIGVGDMGGDVFGNGMLLSKHIRLVAAFNHLHIFCDPNPDAASSFKERQRLFKSRGGWDKYKTSCLSKGGRIYERSAKTLKLTKEIQQHFGLKSAEVTPNTLIRAILKSEVELLWFGGIGTYIKSTQQNHADADDRANDGIRIDGREVMASVIGEGANLGVTHPGRIEYAQKGGRLNTDFIDNSAGVDCSDHEVNIKILLGDIMQHHKMSSQARDKLLEKMTGQVADLVLRDNYQQTQALSMCIYDAPEQMARTASYIRNLEKKGLMDRTVENLPDNEALERMIAEGDTFTRPEFATILCYSKLQFYQDVLGSRLPDEVASLTWLYEYFPKDLQKYGKEIERHKLKREIIATNIINTLINRMGPVFVQSRIDKTGARASNVARAFVIAVEAFGVRALWDAIEGLDNKISADIQADALYEVFSLVKRVVTWILRHEADEIDTKAYIDLLKPGVQSILKNANTILPDYLQEEAHMIEADFIADGLPKALAKQISYLRVLVSACDILKISEQCKGNIKAISKTYFDVGQRLQIDVLREHLRFAKPENHWEARVIGNLNDDLYIYQAKITANVIESLGCPVGSKSLIPEWEKRHMQDIDVLDQLLEEIWRAPSQNSSMLVLAAQRLRILAG